MIPGTNQPDADLEALLLDVVEGQVLSAAGQARVDSALKADPALAGRINAMQRQRAMLVALGGVAVSAPADLVARVQSALDRDEREALLGLAEDEQHSDGRMPASRVEYTGPSVVARLSSAARWLRPLAVAACLALVAGVSAWAVMAWANRPVKPIAHTPGEHPVAPVVPDEAPAVHVADGTDAPTSPGAADEALASATDGTSVPGETIAAPAATSEKHPYGMPLERAVALAREGRLVIRVRAADAATVTSRLDELMSKPSADRALARVSEETAGAVLAMVTPVDMPGAYPGAPGPSPTVVVSKTPGATPAPTPTAPEPGSLSASDAGAWRPTGQPYALHFRASERALREFLRRASPRGGGSVVVLDEAAASLTGDLGADPEALLWWMSPATWDVRPAAAVIIETR